MRKSMWSKLENGDLLFGFVVAIVMILAVIAGIMWGIQYVGPIATVGMAIIVAIQAWYNKQTAETMREQAEIMRQSMILSLKREHTAQLHYKAIEPLIEIFSRLKMENNKLRVETPKEYEIIVDASSLLNGNLENNEESWRLRFIAFATSVNPSLDVYLLYDLVKYHLPEIIEHFKGLVLATANGDESSFNEYLNKI